MFDKETQNRTQAQGEMLLTMLRNSDDGITTYDLQKTNIHYTARLSELRKMGYEIDAERLSSTEFRYTLISEPNIERTVKKPTERLMDAWRETCGEFITREQLMNLLCSNKLSITTTSGGFK